MYQYRAKVVKPVDGDSFYVDLDLGCNVTLTRREIRLLGGDCPEVHGPTKEAGLAATAFTNALIVGQPLIINTVKSPRSDDDKPDDFRRLLASVTLPDGSDLGTRLVEAGHAVPFMVGRK